VVSRRAAPYLAALVAALLATAALWVIDSAQQERVDRDRRAAVLAEMGTMRARVENGLSQRLGAAYALTAYVIADPRLSPVDFTAFASSLLSRQRGVRYLALAPGTTVTNLYPATGNEALVGSNLLDRPELVSATWRAVQGRQFVVAGPIQQPGPRGPVLVALLPIFLPSRSDAPEPTLLWGLALVGIDQDDVLAEATAFALGADLRWALRGTDSTGAEGDVWAGDPRVLDADPQLLDLPLPSGSWQLAAVPASGWATTAPGTWIFRVAGAFTVALFAGLTFFLVRYPARLREAVDEATAALREREETLEQRVRERTHELATLLRVSQTLASTLELEPVVDLVLDQLKRVIDYTGARVWLFDGDEMTLVATASALTGRKGDRVPIASRLLIQEVYLAGSPVIIADIWTDDTPLAASWRQTWQPTASDPQVLRSWMGVPLVVRDRVVGVLAILHREPDHFTPEDAELARAFATQAAVAIENARLYEAAQGRAALEERQRLARDLHDAVTQTLFSASLIAEVLPRIWARSAQQGAERLAELRQLTRGALAEMRTLLAELRPSVLVEAALPELLRQLGEAFTGRARVPVELEVDGEGELPSEVQIALYRVTQEALNNIAKHAGASHVTICLSYRPGGVALSILDDGRGFDPGAVTAEHLGVAIMRERAEAVGGALEVASRPGGGTRVGVVWPALEEEEAA
jgi:signal transduction histidine kinase